MVPPYGLSGLTDFGSFAFVCSLQQSMAGENAAKAWWGVQISAESAHFFDSEYHIARKDPCTVELNKQNKTKIVH